MIVVTGSNRTVNSSFAIKCHRACWRRRQNVWGGQDVIIVVEIGSNTSLNSSVVFPICPWLRSPVFFLAAHCWFKLQMLQSHRLPLLAQAQASFFHHFWCLLLLALGSISLFAASFNSHASAHQIASRGSFIVVISFSSFGCVCTLIVFLWQSSSPPNCLRRSLPRIQSCLTPRVGQNRICIP